MTDWSRFDAYSCNCCKADCINDHRDSCAKARECRRCHSVPVLDEDRPATASDRASERSPTGEPEDRGSAIATNGSETTPRGAVLFNGASDE